MTSILKKQWLHGIFGRSFQEPWSHSRKPIESQGNWGVQLQMHHWKPYFNSIDTQSKYSASIVLYHATHSSIRVQSKLIKNYSNGCWEEKKKAVQYLWKNTIVALVQCLGSSGHRRQDYGQDLFLATLKITSVKKTLCSSGKTNQATFVLKWQRHEFLKRNSDLRSH